MSSLASIPGEARCKQLVHQLLTSKTTCAACSGKLSWKREYGWCTVCRTKVRPKAATWFRGQQPALPASVCLDPLLANSPKPWSRTTGYGPQLHHHTALVLAVPHTRAS